MIDYTGVVIKAVYADDSEKDVTADCSFSPASGTMIDGEPGPLTVTVSYYNFTTNFGIVKALPQIIASGDWWTLYGNGALYIYCVGDMPNYTQYEEVPWREYDDVVSIRRIILRDGVTSIGNYAFNSFSELTRVIIPDSVTNIGRGAFAHCENLTDISANSVINIDEFAFAYTGLRTAYFPACTSVAYMAFRESSSLSSLTLNSGCTIESNAFYLTLDPDSGGVLQIYLRGNTLGTCSDAAFAVWDNWHCYIEPAYEVYSYGVPGLEIYVPENLLNDFKTIWAGGVYAENIFELTD